MYIYAYTHLITHNITLDDIYTHTYYIYTCIHTPIVHCRVEQSLGDPESEGADKFGPVLGLEEQGGDLSQVRVQVAGGGHRGQGVRARSGALADHLVHWGWGFKCSQQNCTWGG